MEFFKAGEPVPLFQQKLFESHTDIRFFYASYGKLKLDLYFARQHNSAVSSMSSPQI